MFHQPILLRAVPSPTGVAYAPQAPFGLAEFVTDIDVYDAEPDGDLDLLVGTVGLGGVAGPARVYLNLGLGAFTPLPPFAGVVAATVATGDLNGDGMTDVVLGGQTWLSTGVTYVPHATHAAPLGKIALADIDLDSDLDLVDAAGTWYEGDGAGAFGAPVAFVPYARAVGTFLATKPTPMDFDADGDLDLIGPGQIAIYSNLTRHAGRTSLMSQGASASLAVFGPPAATWLIAASGAGAPPLALPPYGTIFLNPASLVVVTGGTVPASGRGDIVGFIPGGAGLAGNTLSWQAFVAGALTNSFDTVVLP
jgi:hypothetical protein